MSASESRFVAIWASHEARARIGFRLFLVAAAGLALSLFTTIRVWSRPREVVRIGCDGIPQVVTLDNAAYSEPNEREIRAFATEFAVFCARSDSFSILPPESGLRQWVLTFPFSWRRRLAQDGALLGRLTRIAVETVLAFYAARAEQEGGLGAKSGVITAVQRTSSDMRLNPHLHMIVLDGTWREKDGELAWEGLGHLGTSEVGEVLGRLVRRMERHLRRSGQLRTLDDEAEECGEGDPEANLAASAVFGQAPPAGPQWVSRLAPLEPQALAFDKPLCASLDGFTLHAATRAGALAPTAWCASC